MYILLFSVLPTLFFRVCTANLSFDQVLLFLLPTWGKFKGWEVGVGWSGVQCSAGGVRGCEWASRHPDNVHSCPPLSPVLLSSPLALRGSTGLVSWGKRLGGRPDVPVVLAAYLSSNPLGRKQAL